MNGTTQQIIALAKQGFEKTDIAEALSITVDDVEETLAKSVVAEGGVKGQDKAVIEKQFGSLKELAFKQMENLMNYSDNDAVRLKAALYVLDHQLGLKKPKAENHTTNNLTLIVEQLKQSKDKALKRLGNKLEVVDV